MCNGIYPDGWSGADDSTYYRFSRRDRLAARRRLAQGLGREDRAEPGQHPAWRRSSITDPPARAEPHEAQVAADDRQRADEGLLAAAHRPTASARRVLVQNKFIPQQVDPTSGDVRVLGAEVSYQFFRHALKHVTPDTCR